MRDFADKGGGGVKKAEKSAYVLNGSPLTLLLQDLPIQGLGRVENHEDVRTRDQFGSGFVGNDSFGLATFLGVAQVT